jgi:Tol biopolymer transport system component
MKKVVLCAIALAALPLSARAEIPLRDFFRNPERAGYALSPDGKMLAFREPYEHRMNLFVQPVAGGPAKRVTNEKDRDIAGAFWKGNDHLVYLKDFKGDENFHLVAVDKDGSNLVDLTPGTKVRAEIIDDLPDDDHELLVGLNNRNPEIFDVYRANVDTKKLTLAAQNPGNITGWIAQRCLRAPRSARSDVSKVPVGFQSSNERAV